MVRIGALDGKDRVPDGKGRCTTVTVRIGVVEVHVRCIRVSKTTNCLGYEDRCFRRTTKTH